MGLFSSKTPVDPVTADLQQQITSATEQITPTTTSDELGTDERALMHVSPYNDSDGFEVAGEFARDLHRTERTDATDAQSIEAMEWWFTDGHLRQRFCTATPHRFDQIISARYKHSTVHTPDRTFLDLSEDEYVACTQLRLQQDCAFPIRHPETMANALTVDPYTALASALVGPDDTRALVQCAFTPVDSSWYQRGRWGTLRESTVDDIAERREDGELKGELNPRIVETVRADRYVAMDMQAQRGQPAFQVAVRVVVTAPTKAAVRERLSAITGAFEEYTYAATEQGFTPEHLAGQHLTEGLVQTATRTLTPRHWLKRALFGRNAVLTADGLSALVHLSNQDINAPLVDWARMESGAGTPGGDRQYDGPQEVYTDATGP